ncbi:MAG: bis(5'-nucleosyl)-tetraphosphatase (symmetrical) YqeK [Eubacteriales bacterium]
MKIDNIRKIRKSMEKKLDSKRFEHTLGVAYTAAALALCHGENSMDAQIAGLLHDCAKCMSNDKKLLLCKKHNIQMTNIEKKNLFLLHAKVGSYLAMKKYGVRNPDIISAILNHTTGCPNMSQLEKIVYIADYIEPNRSQAPNLDIIRPLAFQDLDLALFKILEDTLQYLKEIDGEVDPMTQKTYDFYKNLLIEDSTAK